MGKNNYPVQGNGHINEEDIKYKAKFRFVRV